MAFTPATYKFAITVVVSFALFMEALDTTIVNSAIPSIALSLHANPVDLKITLISYLVSLAIFIPISGWLADKYGLKRVYILAIIIFTASSGWCGFAQSVNELIVGRMVQGSGAALLLPVGRLILLRIFERSEVIEAMNRVVVVVAFGLMLGPVFGGILTSRFSWHWIFWVNLPVGVITALLAQAWLRDTPPIPVPPLDKVGFILFGSGTAGVTFGLSALSATAMPIGASISIMLVSILLLIAYVLYSRQKSNPVVNIKLFKLRTFRISAVGNMLARLGIGGVPFLLQLFFQISLGYSAETAGILLAPMSVGVILIKFVALRLLRLVGYRRLLFFNTFILAIAIWLLIIINQMTSLAVICLLTFLYGFLTSLQYSSMNSLAYSDISMKYLSSATSIMSTIGQVSQSFGVAIAALFLRFFSWHETTDIVLTNPIFHRTFIAIALVSLAASFIFLKLEPSDGHQMIDKMVQKKS